ncbi:MAG: hypothetical protein A2X05_14375 [Bacteroidetes bacterium GWE2_41_25]|nr:MAG: hypothetical protein A2X05_14375 [Bacteroidetes bacterium GWE2_41_25]HAM09480.1 hypothetical protein [Bacteroidales bacterium]HBQ84797.1 hypothetical protein [Bacteroidales bacterium]HCU18195.1 hypothetical protein [Bacteroidales bacterium]
MTLNKISIYHTIAIVFIIASMSACKFNKAEFEFRQTDQGFELTENGKPVFFYQQAPKTLTGEYICNNYLHPLYNLNGDILTEEFPPDHPYHRGVFWTWHQIYLDTVSIGDGWINDGISQEVVKVLTEVEKNLAEINAEVLWKSEDLPDGKPFMKEKTSVIVHPAEADTRKIDFLIELNALVDKLEIGGSDDPKGYGGFCLRLNIPDNMVFTSETGTVTPQELQITAGRWMDFSGPFGNDKNTNGITLLCHHENPLYPSPWILRQKGSMQNAVFPGRERIKLDMNTPLILRYRLIIHNGDARAVDLKRMHAEYSE